MGRHVFSTPVFGLLLDLEGHRAKGLQVRHTLSTSYSALVGQLFHFPAKLSTGLATNFQKIPTNKEGFVFPVARPPPDHPPPPALARANAKLFGGINIKHSDK